MVILTLPVWIRNRILHLSVLTLILSSLNTPLRLGKQGKICGRSCRIGPLALSTKQDEHKWSKTKSMITDRFNLLHCPQLTHIFVSATPIPSHRTKTRQTQDRRTTTAVRSGRTDQARDQLDVAARLPSAVIEQRALPTAKSATRSSERDDYANRIMKKEKWEEIALLFGGDVCTTSVQKNKLSPPMNTVGNNYERLTSLQRNTSTPHSMTGSSVNEDDQVSPLVQCFDDINNSC
ncbi:hypothetical protein J6590_073002 [Homalodisca vitripennis]|nr:hypothetical protein J6590_073002 [Homalodisca vitripennis]